MQSAILHLFHLIALLIIPATVSFTIFHPRSRIAPSLMKSTLHAAPVSIVVECEIKADRIDEFLDVMEKDAVGSRQETGCLRFDVLRDKENPCKFYFYEVYTDADAVIFHKEQPHFALWTNFKASGGVVSSISHKCDGIFMDKL